MGQWVAAILTYGLVLAPRLTRLISTVSVIVVVSDFLHVIYSSIYSFSVRLQPKDE